MNADYKIKPWLTVGTNTSVEKRYRKTVSENSEYGSIIGAALNNDPLTPSIYSPNNLPEIYQVNIANGLNYLKDEDGNYYGVSQIAESEQTHPFILRDNHNDWEEGLNVRGTLFANFTPIKDLVITSRFGYRFGYSNSSSYSFPYYANAQNKATNYSLSATSRNNIYYQWENFANYSKTFGKHTISAMAGMSYIDSKSNYVTGSGDVLNQGIEAELTWKDQVGDLRYSISGNISTLKNKVTYLDPSITRIGGTNFFDYIWTYFEVGYPVWYIRGYKFTGQRDRILPPQNRPSYEQQPQPLLQRALDTFKQDC